MATLTSSGLPEGVCKPSAGNTLRPGIEPCGTQQVTQGTGSRRALLYTVHSESEAC